MSSMLQVECYHSEVERIVRNVLLTLMSYETYPSGDAYSASGDLATCAVCFAGS